MNNYGLISKSIFLFFLIILISFCATENDKANYKSNVDNAAINNELETNSRESELTINNLENDIKIPIICASDDYRIVRIDFQYYFAESSVSWRLEFNFEYDNLNRISKTISILEDNVEDAHPEMLELYKYDDANRIISVGYPETRFAINYDNESILFTHFKPNNIIEESFIDFPKPYLVDSTSSPNIHSDPNILVYILRSILSEKIINYRLFFFTDDYNYEITKSSNNQIRF